MSRSNLDKVIVVEDAYLTDTFESSAQNACERPVTKNLLVTLAQPRSSEQQFLFESDIKEADAYAQELYAAAERDSPKNLLEFRVDKFVLEARAGNFGPALQTLAAQAFPILAPGHGIRDATKADKASKTMLRFQKPGATLFEKSFELAVKTHSESIETIDRVVSQRCFVESKMGELFRYVCDHLGREFGFTGTTKEQIEEFLRHRRLKDNLVEAVCKMFTDEVGRRAQLEKVDHEERAKEKRIVEREGIKLRFKRIDT